MANFTYDTSVIISKKITGLLTMPGNFLLSSIVLMELSAGAADSTERKIYETLFRGASQRLALDVLIAVSARRWKAQVVTENWADFKAIQRYCNTTIIRAAQFFRR